MRVVLQRVKYAQVKVNDACIGKIEKGFMLLVGITQDDTLETIQKSRKKNVQDFVYLKMKKEK